MSRTASSFRSKRLQAKKRKHKAYKYGIAIFAIAIFIFGISYLTRSGFLHANEVVIEGTGIVERSALEEIARSEINDSYLGIFSKGNVALYPRRAVEQKIYDQFKSVASVSASFDGLKKVLIKVEEYEPDYLWCSSVTHEKCYYMNRDGYIFSESAGFSNNIIFTYYGIVDPQNPISKIYMPAKEFSEINGFIESVKKLGILPVGLSVRSEGDFELLLDDGGKVLFLNREPFLTTYENLETILNEQSKLDKNYLKHLDYIDVRFASKAFVKLK